MDRIHDILNSVNEILVNAAQKTYKGQKRSELKDSDFLFPETRSFPIVSPQDIPDAISNFGRMKGQMSYDAFLKKLYNMAKRKGPEFVAALPDASKEQLGLNKTVKAQEEENDEISEMDDYKESFYDMSVGSLKAIAAHAQDIINNLENETVKNNLTAPHLQGMIAVAEDHMRSIHDFVMYVEFEQEDEEEEEEEETEEPTNEESKVEPIEQKKKKLKRVRIKDLPHYTFVMPDAPAEADSYNDINQFELGPSTMKNLDDLYGDDEENTKLNDTNAMKTMMELYANIYTIIENIADPVVKKKLTDAMKNVRMTGMVEAMKKFEDFLMFLPLADDDKTMFAAEKRPGLWDNIRKKKERMGKNYRPAKRGDKDRPDPDQWEKLTK
jgi:hypothetical protein